MSGDLITWLRAQLDDDEAEVAKHPDGEDHGMPLGLSAEVETDEPVDGDDERDRYVLRISKVRALAEVALKRHLLDCHRPYDVMGKLFFCSACSDTYPEYEEEWPCDTVRQLAAVYAARPGYRGEWRPA